MSIHDFKAVTIEGEEISLKDYKDKVILIVNTASKCGFTPQYEGLEKLYKEYSDKGFVVLGFPCNQFAEQEPGEGHEIQKFCSLNYGVSFPLFKKVEVRGENINPIFKYLVDNTEFKGFDMNHPAGKPLTEFLQEKFPEFLEGNSIKWNFTKFLVDKDGSIVKRYEPTVEPMDIAKDIEKLL